MTKLRRSDRSDRSDRSEFMLTIQKMMPKFSASYDGLNVKNDEFVANHVDLARFDNREDKAYRQVVKHLTRVSVGPKPHGKSQR